MAELSAKKARKEKRKLAQLSQDLNTETATSPTTPKTGKKIKKEKRFAPHENHLAAAENGDKENRLGGGVGEKMEEDGEGESSHLNKLQKDKEGKIPNSLVRAAKKRMLLDFGYISDIMAVVHIPMHRGRDDEGGAEDDDDDPEDDMVNPVSAEMKQKMREKIGGGGEERAATHQELRDRLHRKMAEIRGRNEVTNTARAQRKEKLKLKRLDDKSAANKELKSKLIKAGKAAGGAAGTGNLKKLKSDLLAAGGKQAAANQRPKVVTEDGKVIFSKFDFRSDEAVPTPESGGHSKKHLDPRAALAKIDKKREKLKMWEEKGKVEKVKRIEDNAAWDTLLNRAEGTVVKDDEVLLKKSLKRLEAKKRSSKRKWEARTEEVGRKKEGVQAKRKENIQKRKKERKEKEKKKKR